VRVAVLRVEQVWIQCNSIRLRGELWVPDVVPAPAILICHGMDVRGFRGLGIYSRLAEEACSAGFVCLLFDFRGVGDSLGVFDYGFGEQEDVKCVLGYLVSRSEVDLNSVFVVGHSLGGAVSLYALRGESRVRGLVLWSVPKNHDYNVRKFIKRTHGTVGLFAFLMLARLDRIFGVSWFYRLEVYGIALRPRYVMEKLMKLDECEAASKLLDIPVMIMIGRSDVVVGVDEAEDVYGSANEPKALTIIESADHVYRGKEPELIRKTLDWIKTLKQRKSQQNHASENALARNSVE